ncbi:unnamed protein product [Prorocentrum cordatum]|uniref:Subtilisin n=1 Tax=Prorocentrum cordatum TaxID=2364126 RepID=A0ABN9YE88_9DINO|nr:unnamed protein product [Polarella glacialis]
MCTASQMTRTSAPGLIPQVVALVRTSFGLRPQPPPKTTFGAAVPIHGYAGWVPGRVGESVCGERQCQTNHVAETFSGRRIACASPSGESAESRCWVGMLVWRAWGWVRNMGGLL